MTLLFYLAKKSFIAQRFNTLIDWQTNGIDKEFFESRQLFIERLRVTKFDSVCVVVAPSGLKDLLALVSYKELFWHLPVIVCLPNDSRKTSKEAFRLRPRFLARSDIPTEDLLQVLERIMDREQRSCEKWRSSNE